MIRIGTSLRIGCPAYALQHPHISVVYKPAAAASCFCHNRNFSTRSIRKDAGRKISASHNSRTPKTQQKEAGGEADRRAHHVLAEASTLEVPLRLWILVQPQHRGEAMSDSPASNVNFCSSDAFPWNHVNYRGGKKGATSLHSGSLVNWSVFSLMIGWWFGLGCR